MNFARLNHILIPKTKAGRDRARRTWLVRAFRPGIWLYLSLTDEGRWLAVSSILVGAFGLEVPVNQVHLLWCALVAVVVGSLAVKPLFALPGVRVEVHAPPRTTIGDEVQLTLLVANEGSGAHRGIRIERPFLPWDGSWTGPAPAIPLLPPGARTRVVSGARFVERGEHHLDEFAAQALVPLGLAQGRPVWSSGSRFLVVPRPARVERLVTPQLQRYQPGGVALASKTGESMELLGVRPYRPGDPVRDLHARSWARLGFPVVREYQQEYFSRIGVVLDTDGTAAPPERLESAISLAAGVVAYLSRGEALVDLLVVGDRVHPLTLGRSLGYLEQALDHLACVEPGPPPDPAGLVRRLGPFLGRLSCVIVVALAWDEPRQVLADAIRRSGVGCCVLHVVGGPGTGAAGELIEVPAQAIDRGEALLL